MPQEELFFIQRTWYQTDAVVTEQNGTGFKQKSKSVKQAICLNEKSYCVINQLLLIQSIKHISSNYNTRRMKPVIKDNYLLDIIKCNLAIQQNNFSCRVMRTGSRFSLNFYSVSPARNFNFIEIVKMRNGSDSTSRANNYKSLLHSLPT